MNPKLHAATPEKPRDSHSMRDEALFQRSVSRETPRSLLKRQRVLDTLVATQEVPRYTRPLERTPEFHATTQKKPQFPPPQLEMRVDSPAEEPDSPAEEINSRFHRERNPDLAVAPQEEADLILKLEHIPGSRASIQKDHNFPNHSRKCDSSALT